MSRSLSRRAGRPDPRRLPARRFHRQPDSREQEGAGPEAGMVGDAAQGAMLSARAQGDPALFDAILTPARARLAPSLA